MADWGNPPQRGFGITLYLQKQAGLSKNILERSADVDYSEVGIAVIVQVLDANLFYDYLLSLD